MFGFRYALETKQASVYIGIGKDAKSCSNHCWFLSFQSCIFINFWGDIVADLSKITHIDDFQSLARRRVPKMFYDYADSGSWTQQTYHSNDTDMQRLLFKQRAAVDVNNRSTASTILSAPVSK